MINFMENFEFKVTDEIRTLVAKIANLYKANLEPSRSTGKLSNFQTVHVSINDSTFSIEFELEDYWKYVEYGRSKGKQPPIDAIEQWIRIKPIVPDPRSGRIPSTKQLAYVIARKIGREGFKGKQPLKKTIESQEFKDIERAIIQALKNQVAEYINSTL